jgi:FKBP-type peptidyl-prolyl cis-trans isomerase
VRRAPALLVAASLLLITLSACSSDPNASCASAASPGPASALISVSGPVGSAPKVSFPTPLKTATTQRTVLSAGKGAPIESGQEILMDFSLYNATTGALIQADNSKTAAVVVGKSIKGLDSGLLCMKQGARVALAISPKDGFGTSGSSFGIGPNDSIVMVVDVAKTYLPRANGVPVPSQPGFPMVVLAPDGTPGISVPVNAPPTSLKVAELKQGNGATVKQGNSVVVQYTGVLWKERTVFDSTWQNGQPATLVAADGSKVQGGVVSGFAKALVGQKVGSQFIAIIPPGMAYGSAGSQTVPANSTLVFVVDVLGIQ